MAAKKDCDAALRRNTALIQEAFINGSISMADAKIAYNNEVNNYNACLGRGVVSPVYSGGGIKANGITYVGFDMVRSRRY